MPPLTVVWKSQPAIRFCELAKKESTTSLRNKSEENNPRYLELADFEKYAVEYSPLYESTDWMNSMNKVGVVLY